MGTTDFSTDKIPIEVPEKARHLWESIKPLVQVKPEDEPQVLFRMATCLVLYPLGEKLLQQLGESPAFHALMEKAKAQMEAQVVAMEKELGVKFEDETQDGQGDAGSGGS